MALEVAQEITLFFSIESVSLAVFKHLLLFLKAYLLGELERVLVLLSLLRRARSQLYIEIQSLFLAVVLHSVFRLPFHCPGGIEDGIAVIIIYRGLGSAEIIFEDKARPAIRHGILHQLRILFQFIWLSTHNQLILWLWSKDNAVL